MIVTLWVSIGLFFLAFWTSQHKTYQRFIAMMYTFLIFVYMILTTFYIVANYFTGEGINDAVIFHLRYGLDGSGYGDYYVMLRMAHGSFARQFFFGLHNEIKKERHEKRTD